MESRTLDESEILRFTQNDNNQIRLRNVVGQALDLLRQPMRLPWKKRVQKMLNRLINSWRASIACSGFIRLSTFSLRSRSIAASSRTSWLRAFHFAYLPQPMPSARSAETIQTVMSVAVTRSIGSKKRVSETSSLRVKDQPAPSNQIVSSNLRHRSHRDHEVRFCSTQSK